MIFFAVQVGRPQMCQQARGLPFVGSPHLFISHTNSYNRFSPHSAVTKSLPSCEPNMQLNGLKTYVLETASVRDQNTLFFSHWRPFLFADTGDCAH
jgi:hypothetical protein